MWYQDITLMFSPVKHYPFLNFLAIFFSIKLFSKAFFFLYLRDGVVDDILLGFDDLQGILLWFLRFYRNIKHSADFYGKIQSIFLLNIDQVYEVYIS